MFCTFLQSLNLDGSCFPLLLVLYVILCTHVCLVYTSCTTATPNTATWSSRDGDNRWRWLTGVLALEVGVTCYGVFASDVHIILEVIGIALVQTLVSLLYFIVSEDRGGGSKRCVNPHHHHRHHHQQHHQGWRWIVSPPKLRNAGG